MSSVHRRESQCILRRGEGMGQVWDEAVGITLGVCREARCSAAIPYGVFCLSPPP